MNERIHPEGIPGTTEFFDAVEAGAKAKFKEAMGTDFDEFDSSHVVRLNYFVQQEVKYREQVYEEAASRTRARLESEDNYNKLQSALSGVLATDELKKKFTEELGKLSFRTVQELETEIAKGEFARVVKFASKVAGGRAAPSEVKKKGNKPVTKRDGVILFSDMLK